MVQGEDREEQVLLVDPHHASDLGEKKGKVTVREHDRGVRCLFFGKEQQGHNVGVDLGAKEGCVAVGNFALALRDQHPQGVKADAQDVRVQGVDLFGLRRRVDDSRRLAVLCRLANRPGGAFLVQGDRAARAADHRHKRGRPLVAVFPDQQNVFADEIHARQRSAERAHVIKKSAVANAFVDAISFL